MRRTFGAAVLAITLTGCALLGARKPGADWDASKSPDCNSGKGAVFVDGTVAAMLGLGALASADSSGSAAGMLVLGGVVYAVSAGYGSSSANKCREAIEQHDAYVVAMAHGDWDTPDQRVEIPVEPDPTPQPPIRTVEAPPPKPPAPQPEPEPEAADDDTWAAFWVEVVR